MEHQQITKAEEGKQVVDADGAVVGHIIAVRNGQGYVAQAASLRTVVKTKLGLPRDVSGAHPFDEGSVERITDEAVHLRGRF